MKAFQKLILIMLASSLFARSSKLSTNSSTVATSVIKANGMFANQMYRELSTQGGNVLISPASAHACLSMLYQGATGTIKEDFGKILQVTPSEAAEGYHSIMYSINIPTIAKAIIANKIYVEETLNLKQSFIDIVQKKFLSEVEAISFKDPGTAAEIINKWVKRKTANRIQGVFGNEDLHSAVLALVNTMYFKDFWDQPFSDSRTKQEPFYLKDKSTVNVAMMHKTSEYNYKEDEKLDAKIVKIPYSNMRYGMVIVLPNKKDGITDLEQKIQDVDISQIAEGSRTTKIYISLPKFKFSTQIDLKDILSNMGLGKIFHPSNDFDGLVKSPYGVFVGKAVQKVFIQVDEVGSEAAAVTVETFEQLLTNPSEPVEVPVDFRIDHPFMFLLTHEIDLGVNHNHQNILFYGKVEKPVSEGF